MREVDLRLWKHELNNMSIVSEVDKNKSILCISCIRGYIEIMKAMAFHSPGFSRCPPNFKHVVSQVDCASEMFAYTGVRMYRNHEV